jgi:hypothetical protein
MVVSILVVDDEADVAELLRQRFHYQPGRLFLSRLLTAQLSRRRAGRLRSPFGTLSRRSPISAGAALHTPQPPFSDATYVEPVGRATKSVS